MKQLIGILGAALLLGACSVATAQDSIAPQKKNTPTERPVVVEGTMKIHCMREEDFESTYKAMGFKKGVLGKADSNLIYELWTGKYKGVHRWMLVFRDTEYEVICRIAGGGETIPAHKTPKKPDNDPQTAPKSLKDMKV